MAGMFFTLDEVVEKLGKSKEEVQQLVDAGNLREFWDGSKQLFKVSDIEAMLAGPVGEGEMVEVESSAEEEPVIESDDVVIAEDDIIADDVVIADDDVVADDELVSLEETGGTDALDMLVGEDAGSEGEDILEAEELTEALGEADDLDSLMDSADASEDIAPLGEEAEASAEMLLDEDSAAPIDESDESLKLQSTAVDENEESLQLQGTSLADASFASAADSASELTSAISADDSMDLLLSDDTGLESPMEDANLLSDETLSNLIGDSSVPDDAVAEDEVSLGELTNADTNMGIEGINVLAESESNFDLTADSKSETLPPDAESEFDLDIEGSGGASGLGDLDTGINLDSLGSGSGLLDLSLEADDTSLGAVLDDILPAADEMGDMPETETIGGGSVEGSVSEEADKIFEAAEPQAVMAQENGVAVAAQYVEPEPTGSDNLFGGLLLIPFAILIYAALILFLSFAGVKPGMLTAVSKDVSSIAMLWWVFLGLIVVLGIVFTGAGMSGSGSGEKKAKPKKEKKAKPKKEKKKKPKKEKKKKEKKPKKKKK